MDALQVALEDFLEQTRSLPLQTSEYKMSLAMLISVYAVRVLYTTPELVCQ